MEIDQKKSIIRSLLQKAVRRGNIETLKKCFFYLLNNGDQDWLRKRLFVIIFEEASNYSLNINFENKPEYILKQYLELSSLVKNKNSCSLGILSYYLSEGDKSVFWNLNKEEIKHINNISHAIKRPKDFWNWAINESKNNFKKSNFLNNAYSSFKKVSWPWDKAFIIGAAYLSLFEDIYELNYSKKIIDLPSWVGIDKHTAIGKNAIKSIAYKNNINEEILLYLSFHFEGSICNEISENSYWLEKEINWNFKKLNLDYNQGKKIWENILPQLINTLKKENDLINHELNSIDTNISLTNLEQMKLF